MRISERRLKQIIREELKRYYTKPDKNVHLTSKRGKFIVYYYNQNCPKGGEWHRVKGLPGKEDIKGSMDSARNYVSFILDYGQLMADLENKKAGEMKYSPKDFAYDSIMAIDTETGDIFGPADNPATENDPNAGTATKCQGDMNKSGEISSQAGTRAEKRRK